MTIGKVRILKFITKWISQIYETPLHLTLRKLQWLYFSLKSRKTILSSVLNICILLSRTQLLIVRQSAYKILSIFFCKNITSVIL